MTSMCPLFLYLVVAREVSALRLEELDDAIEVEACGVEEHVSSYDHDLTEMRDMGVTSQWAI